jgi:hypothetical protein
MFSYFSFFSGRCLFFGFTNYSYIGAAILYYKCPFALSSIIVLVFILLSNISTCTVSMYYLVDAASNGFPAL